MKIFKFIISIILILFLFNKSLNAQIETKLLSSCASQQIEIPVVVKNLENIKLIKLNLKFDTNLLLFDTSYYHSIDFENGDDINKIVVTQSEDRILINRSAFNGVSLADGLLLSLVFSPKGPEGSAVFEWDETMCEYQNINNLLIDSDYEVDAELSLPFESDVEFSFDQFQIGCRDDSENGGCKAQVDVSFVGGLEPYTYQWYDPFYQRGEVAVGLCQGPTEVVIKDAANCYYGNAFIPVIYPAINPEDVAGFSINYTPEEIFITKPYVAFTTDPGGTIIEKYEWDFGDETTATTQNAQHTYQGIETYTVSLRTENIDGCDTIITTTVEVKELNFCIPNVFTPNGDGYNDEWIFKIVGASSGSDPAFKTGISDESNCTGEDLVFEEHFKSASLVLYTRGGNKVYECNNCSEYWDGASLPDGVYFYVFSWEGEYSNGTEQGNVTIMGSSK